MNLSRIISFFTILAVSAACNKDVDLPATKARRKIVLIGELEAGKNVSFRAGQSIAISAGNELRFETVQDLSINLVGQQTTTPLSARPDSATGYLYTVPFVADYNVQAGSSYTVIATHNSLGVATAKVNIPSPFTARIVEYRDARFGQDNTIQFKVEINDPEGVNYYAIECFKQDIAIKGSFFYNGIWQDILQNKGLYDELKKSGNVTEKFDTTFYDRYNRLQVYTDDVNTENVKEYNSFNPFNRLLITDDRFNEQRYTTRMYMIKPSDTTAKGRVLIRVKSLSKDYYSYLKQYGFYTPGNFNSFNVAQNTKGNIEGGLGILGGVYTQQFAYVFDNFGF